MVFLTKFITVLLNLFYTLNAKLSKSI